MEKQRMVFDIGANRGSFTNFFLENGFDKVIAVEANPEIAKILSRKFAATDKVVVVNKAVSNVSGKMIDFWVCNADGISTADEMWHTTGRFTIDPYHKWKKIQVETTNIDELVKQYGSPNHIKMDIEGYESTALKGMSLAYCPIRFEWTEEKLDEINGALHHLYNIGYRYFGLVVEIEDDFDMRPTSYFADVDLFMQALRNDISVKHQQLKSSWHSPWTNEKFFWGMIWAFREIDAQKLFLTMKGVTNEKE